MSEGGLGLSVSGSDFFVAFDGKENPPHSRRQKLVGRGERRKR